MENQIFHLQYAMDTFYFLVCGALVMWMAAGFAMLEAGLVRSKNTTEILTKNVVLFAIACIIPETASHANFALLRPTYRDSRPRDKAQDSLLPHRDPDQFVGVRTGP